MTLTQEQVHAGWAWQREICDKAGADSYVAIITDLMERLGRDSDITDLLTADGQDPIRSAQCLRVLGAVNRVALAESAGWLTAYYPTFGGHVDLDRLVPAFVSFMKDRLPAVRQQMSTGVQTNEVGRSAPLSAAINHVATATGLPLRLLEVGASAGLNLLVDQYYVTAGEKSWGPAMSPLRLTGQFIAGDPPAGTTAIVERRGCDLNPIDALAPGVEDLLRSFVWPEHVERMARLTAALQIARSTPKIPIDAEDACTWAARWLDDLPAGHTTVLFHSILLAYLDADERARFGKTIRVRGARATGDRPLAWISLEPSEADASVADLICQIWPDGRRFRLARTTPHGGKVRWNPEEVPE